MQLLLAKNELGAEMLNRKSLTVLFFIIVCFFSATAGKNNKVHLYGKLLHFNNAVQIEDISEYQYLFPTPEERIIVPDDSGYFNITFEILRPKYYRIGRNILYLQSGFDISVIIDYEDASKAAFSGTGSVLCNYLADTPFPKMGSYLDAGMNSKLTPEGTLDFIVDESIKRRRVLDSLKDIPIEFRQLENARIRADIINSCFSGYNYLNEHINEASQKDYKKKYRLLAPLLIKKYAQDFINPEYLKLVVYRNIVSHLIKDYPSTTNNSMDAVKDWVLMVKLVDEMKASVSKDSILAYRAKIKEIGSLNYRSSANLVLKNLVKFGNGDYAENFIAIDINGNKVSLNNLKGKVIYVDIWATWCIPCLTREMPAFELLKDLYKSNPDIVFLSLSIDDDLAKWKKNVFARKSTGLQWIANRIKLAPYNIVSIPRTLLIDKKFRLVSLLGPLPSSSNITQVIDSLLK